jgi:hypothetical protein
VLQMAVFAGLCLALGLWSFAKLSPRFAEEL